MRPKWKLSKEEESRLVAAIRRAEEGHRGEVLVHLERKCPGGEPLARAAQLFEQLGLRRTAEDTGVILYVALSDRKAAVYAGQGVHGAAQPGFWQEVVDALARGFREGSAVTALEAAVERIGDLLRTAVPGEDTRGNELPNVVSVS
ncbi:TPM domain-containing protein [Archangium lansingense]|uniref:TPM domain-containing protein n=1 Tax=Archangium lansingense TaxID=2995310 RepID=A0ABT4A6T5_9BACT|nr:TPM domain-containing protein [Archangium lansinium]MCY1077306.1 TPM domain-containing protein [Archangium lansinium]